MERLIPKKVQAAQKETKSAIRYGFSASADLRVTTSFCWPALGLAASAE